MRLSEVLSEEERAVRFVGKRRKVEMERTRGAVGGSKHVKSTLDNLMGLPRKSVIRPRSELFHETLQVDQHRVDGESHLHCIGEKERELIWNYIYQHKKFNRTTRVPFSETHQKRPSVIVRNKYIGEEDLGRAPNVDFHDTLPRNPI